MEEIEKDIVQKKHKYYENGTMKVSLGKIEWTQDNEQPKKEMMFMIWQKKIFLKQLLFPTSRRKNLKLQGKNMKVMVQKAS